MPVREVFAAFHRFVTAWWVDLDLRSDREFHPCGATLMQQQYGEYLTQFKDEAYRDQGVCLCRKRKTPHGH